MKGRNDNAFIVQEVVIRDPVTLKTYRVEIEYATLYASIIQLKFVGEDLPVIQLGIRDGEVEVRNEAHKNSNWSKHGPTPK